MNPYDNNPYAGDDTEIRNEHDANRALAETARNREREELANIFRLETDKYGFWK